MQTICCFKHEMDHITHLLRFWCQYLDIFAVGRVPYRRGRRGGLAVKLKLYLAQQRESRPFQGLRGKGLACDYFIRWRSLDVVRNWNITLTPSADALFPAYGSPRVHRGGVCLNHLRAFFRARQSEVSSEDPPRLRMALLNARSVVNKTVIINDFFSSRELDLLFITESWITTGDLSPFSELLPPKCLFFNSPRKSGRGEAWSLFLKTHFLAGQLW